jgi:hypothetical protein
MRLIENFQIWARGVIKKIDRGLNPFLASSRGLIFTLTLVLKFSTGGFSVDWRG